MRGLCLVLLMTLAPLGCGRSQTTSPLPEARLTTHTAALSRTVVTADLDHPIPADTNVLWCASMQLAWNEAMRQVGGPIALDRPSTTAEALNRSQVTRDQFEARSFVALAGTQGRTVKEARRQVAQKFGEQADTPLLDMLDGAPADGFVFYAYLRHAMAFAQPFDELDPMRFTQSDARFAAFGVDSFHEGLPHHQRLADAVAIRWLHSDDTGLEPELMYVVELLTDDPDHRLVLAAVERHRTLGQTIDSVRRKLTEPNTALVDPAEIEATFAQLDKNNAPRGQREQTMAAIAKQLNHNSRLMEGESLRVPVIDFDLTHRFGDLVGRSITNPDFAWAGQPIGLAAQRIRFRLDRTGAMVESEAAGAVFDAEPRRFDFNRPHLVLVLNRRSNQPLLACWVANDELFVPAGPPGAAHQNEGGSIFGDGVDGDSIFEPRRAP